MHLLSVETCQLRPSLWNLRINFFLSASFLSEYISYFERFLQMTLFLCQNTQRNYCLLPLYLLTGSVSLMWAMTSFGFSRCIVWKIIFSQVDGVLSELPLHSLTWLANSESGKGLLHFRHVKVFCLFSSLRPPDFQRPPNFLPI